MIDPRMPITTAAEAAATIRQAKVSTQQAIVNQSHSSSLPQTITTTTTTTTIQTPQQQQATNPNPSKH
jgi:hypothetical protein